MAVRKLRATSSGEWLVQAPHSEAFRLRRAGGQLRPDGLWLVSSTTGQYLIPQNLNVRSTTTPVGDPNISVEEVAAWFEHLSVPDGADISRDGYQVSIRLTRYSVTATQAIKQLPLRQWQPSRRCWVVPARTAEQRVRIEHLLAGLQSLSGVPNGRQRYEVELIFPLSLAPSLNVVMHHCGRDLIFHASGRLFRLHEGHARAEPRLEAHIGEYASVFYGEPQREA